MSEELTVITERVDDIPLLLTLEQRIRIPGLIDKYFTAHGNWQGLGPGMTTAVWLTHILSEADHRLSHVRPWVANRLETLRSSVGQDVTELDFTDDRLGLILTAFGEDARWMKFEAALNAHTLRVYDLRAERVRVDSTTTSGYWQVTEDGLFQFGYSKDHRASHQPQIKIMLSTLDPLGMPVVTQVVSGNRSDDPLYIPAIRQVRESVGQSGLLYVGDSKMPAHETRAFVEAGNDYYLGPLSKTQLPEAVLESYLEPVRRAEQVLQPIYRTPLDGETKLIAEGFELEEPMEVQLGEDLVVWTERRLVIRSFAQIESQAAALQARLTRCQGELHRLNEHKTGRKIYQEIAPIRKKVEQILNRHQANGLFHITYEVRDTITSPKGKPRPVVWVQTEPNTEAIEQAKMLLGWRVYVTNQPAAQLSLEQAVLAYREEYLVEHSFGRLKGKPLSLSPMYLQDDRRATGLVRLLSLGVRILTLLEFTVRRQLAQTNETLSGVYAGNPKRSTNRPSATLMLEAFEHITLSVIRIGSQVHRHLSPLTGAQLKILTSLGLSDIIYTRLIEASGTPP